MPRKPNKPQETQMGIISGNIAGLMQRRGVSPDEMCQILGIAKRETLNRRFADPGLFTGFDLNHICQFFNVTLEQLAHDWTVQP